jgi:hypothetical protein
MSSLPRKNHKGPLCSYQSGPSPKGQSTMLSATNAIAPSQRTVRTQRPFSQNGRLVS